MPPKKNKRQDKLDVNFLLNDKNVTPRQSNQQNPPAPPSSSFSLGSSQAAGGSSTDATALEQRMRRNMCHICKHVFCQPADLRKHISTVHEKQRPFKCQLCDKRFGEKGTSSIALFDFIVVVLTLEIRKLEKTYKFGPFQSAPIRMSNLRLIFWVQGRARPSRQVGS